jgi:hypothetical protein
MYQFLKLESNEIGGKVEFLTNTGKLKKYLITEAEKIRLREILSEDEDLELYFSQMDWFLQGL